MWRNERLLDLAAVLMIDYAGGTFDALFRLSSKVHERACTALEGTFLGPWRLLKRCRSGRWVTGSFEDLYYICCELFVRR